MDGLLSIRRYAASRRERRLPVGSHEGIRRAVAAGALTAPAVVKGKINPREADRQLSEAHPVENVGTPESHSTTEPRTFSETRLARERLRFRREHLATLEAEGALTDAAAVRAQCVAVGALIKDLVLALPDRAAGKLVGLDLAETHAALSTEAHGLLADIVHALERVGAREAKS